MKEFCQTSDVDLGLTCLGLGNDQESQECPNNTANVSCVDWGQAVILHVLQDFYPYQKFKPKWDDFFPPPLPHTVGPCAVQNPTAPETSVYDNPIIVRVNTVILYCTCVPIES